MNLYATTYKKRIRIDDFPNDLIVWQHLEADLHGEVLC